MFLLKVDQDVSKGQTMKRRVRELSPTFFAVITSSPFCRATIHYVCQTKGNNAMLFCLKLVLRFKPKRA